MQWSFGVTSWEVFTGGTIPMVGLVHWYFFSFFVMESGSANPQIQLAQMKCKFNCEFKCVPKAVSCSQLFRV